MCCIVVQAGPIHYDVQAVLARRGDVHVLRVYALGGQNARSDLVAAVVLGQHPLALYEPVAVPDVRDQLPRLVQKRYLDGNGIAGAVCRIPLDGDVGGDPLKVRRVHQIELLGVGHDLLLRDQPQGHELAVVVGAAQMVVDVHQILVGHQKVYHVHVRVRVRVVYQGPGPQLHAVHVALELRSRRVGRKLLGNPDLLVHHKDLLHV